MDSTKCITDPQWLRFSQGKLSPDEVLQLRAHAASCELCADLLEGIEAMPRPAALQTRVDELNLRIQKKWSPQAKSIPLVYWLSAAAVFLVVAFIFLWLDPKPAPTAAVQTPAATPADTGQPTKPLLSDDAYKPHQPIVVAKKHTPAPVTKVPVVTSDTKTMAEDLQAEQDKRVAESEESSSKATQADDVKKEEAETYKESVAASDNVSTESVTATKALKQKNVQTERKQTLPASVSNNNVNMSNNAYNNMSNEPALDTATENRQLRLAESYLEHSRYDSCSLALAPVLGSARPETRSHALYLQGLMLHQQGRKKEAVMVMKQAAAGPTEYSTKAAQWLKEH